MHPLLLNGYISCTRFVYYMVYRPRTKDAILQVNSFDRLSHSCTQITDLSDGIILFEVLAHM
jgi:hypothetical protein